MPAKKSAPKKEKPAAGNNNVWAFVGTDDMAVKDAAAALSRKLIPPEAAEFGLEIVDGSADNSEHAQRIVRNALEALQTLPFFGGEKVVWLRGVNFLADTITGRSESTQNALAALMAFMEAGVPADVKFILSASEVDKRRSFFLNLKKVAKLEVFDLIDTSRSGWEEAVADLAEVEAALVEQLREEVFEDDARSCRVEAAGRLAPRAPARARGDERLDGTPRRTGLVLHLDAHAGQQLSQTARERLRPRAGRALLAVVVERPADGDGLEPVLGVKARHDEQRLARRIRPDGLSEHPQRIRHRDADAARSDVDGGEAEGRCVGHSGCRRAKRNVAAGPLRVGGYGPLKATARRRGAAAAWRPPALRRFLRAVSSRDLRAAAGATREASCSA